MSRAGAVISFYPSPTKRVVPASPSAAKALALSRKSCSNTPKEKRLRAMLSPPVSVEGTATPATVNKALTRLTAKL